MAVSRRRSLFPCHLVLLYRAARACVRQSFVPQGGLWNRRVPVLPFALAGALGAVTHVRDLCMLQAKERTGGHVRDRRTHCSPTSTRLRMHKRAYTRTLRSGLV